MSATPTHDSTTDSPRLYLALELGAEPVEAGLRHWSGQYALASDHRATRPVRRAGRGGPQILDSRLACLRWVA